MGLTRGPATLTQTLRPEWVWGEAHQPCQGPPPPPSSVTGPGPPLLGATEKEPASGLRTRWHNVSYKLPASCCFTALSPFRSSGERMILESAKNADLSRSMCFY